MISNPLKDFIKAIVNLIAVAITLALLSQLSLHAEVFFINWDTVGSSTFVRVEPYSPAVLEITDKEYQELLPRIKEAAKEYAAFDKEAVRILGNDVTKQQLDNAYDNPWDSDKTGIIRCYTGVDRILSRHSLLQRRIAEAREEYWEVKKASSFFSRTEAQKSALKRGKEALRLYVGGTASSDVRHINRKPKHALKPDANRQKLQEVFLREYFKEIRK